ncbi:MAG TPA: NAD-dependent deacylase [Candidatus Baltobacteraceae bacterium]|nr:NAD-dependent deacylase [Candidatus Baltobacteraceae bacterium]
MPSMNGARERLARARTVCVLSGSGISAESGLPTFRGAGGLWRTHRFEELASPHGFARDPRLVWTWYNERRLAHASARPNAAHFALCELERRVPDFTLVTQNVDSLHWRAGSKNVLELHGNLREARCTRCDARRSLAGGMPLEEIEHECGGRFRPDIVWFGETLPAQTWELAVAAAGRAEVMLVVGTSGLVNPAALLCTHFAAPHAYVVEINPEDTVITPHASVSLRGSAADIVPQLVNGA